MYLERVFGDTDKIILDNKGAQSTRWIICPLRCASADPARAGDSSLAWSSHHGRKRSCFRQYRDSFQSFP